MLVSLVVVCAANYKVVGVGTFGSMLDIKKNMFTSTNWTNQGEKLTY